MSSREAVIVDSVRTGLAKSFRGKFNRTRPDDMAAHLVRALLRRNLRVDPAEIEDCVVGAGFPEGPQGHNLGRVGTEFGARRVKVLPVLPATGVTAQRRGDKRVRASDSLSAHLRQGFQEVRRPVSVAPIDRHLAANQ